jgi:hypothetical protein
MTTPWKKNVVGRCLRSCEHDTKTQSAETCRPQRLCAFALLRAGGPAICSPCPSPIPSCRVFTFTSLYPTSSTSMFTSTRNRPEPRHTPRFRSESEKRSSSASAHTHFLLTRPMADHLDLELNVDTGTQPRHQAKPSHRLRGSSSFSICEHFSLKAWLVALGSGRALPMSHPRGISTGQGVLCAGET